MKKKSIDANLKYFANWVLTLSLKIEKAILVLMNLEMTNGFYSETKVLPAPKPMIFVGKIKW